PSLLQLPVELLDLIASFVPTHRDLVSLALTCHAIAYMAIPAHTAYRTLRIHSQRGPALGRLSPHARTARRRAVPRTL
ncbi:hypothetical protein EDB84DRAFT_1281098, partial [Lactarius hengduanensis]